MVILVVINQNQMLVKPFFVTCLILYAPNFLFHVILVVVWCRISVAIVIPYYLFKTQNAQWCVVKGLKFANCVLFVLLLIYYILCTLFRPQIQRQRKRLTFVSFSLHENVAGGSSIFILIYINYSTLYHPTLIIH